MNSKEHERENVVHCVGYVNCVGKCVMISRGILKSNRTGANCINNKAATTFDFFEICKRDIILKALFERSNNCIRC